MGHLQPHAGHAGAEEPTRGCALDVGPLADHGRHHALPGRPHFISAAVLAFAFFILPTRIHERYAFPFFALALPLAATSSGWLRAYLVLSAVGFANVYAVYSLPPLQNIGSFRPELFDNTIFSPAGIIVLSLINTLGLAWLLWEVLPWRMTVPGFDARSMWAGALMRLQRWQRGEDVVGVGVDLARGGKLLRGVRQLPFNLVRPAQLKSSVGISGGELDGTPQ